MSGGSSAALMDDIYRYQRHIYDLSRKYYLLGRDRLLADLRAEPGETILEMGCGTGRNLVKAARLYPQAKLYGIDLSEEMLATARKSVAKAGLSDRIQLAKADATQVDAEALFGISSFDHVMFSYSLSMIPPWQAALDQGARLLGESGRLHLVDFGQQENMPALFKRLLFKWLAAFHVEPRAGMDRFLEQLAVQYGKQSSHKALYRGYATLGTLSPN
ncbi:MULTISPECIES: class I SAM-dependent methyltransferase [Pseudovibrio]|uniref:class I SAM-dependent methyltransferase n=1 Tax=Stappiaceae TaxID=2821832 RepID=UPI0023662486|nr:MULTISPECIES: methyltransferase domain-containing protein [Pseudovibrio]MDD7911215.1 methyltransferase domain-containing protein [Pseudovibrio exalbescens]MDX5593098.1 methyltransferase domain-containing protein [Pseudovibrio sp. SPO723]